MKDLDEDILKRLKYTIKIILKQQQHCIEEINNIELRDNALFFRIKTKMAQYEKLEKKLDFLKEGISYILGISDLDIISLINSIKLGGVWDETQNVKILYKSLWP